MVKNVYLVILQDCEDTYVKIVDKETYDYIHKDVAMNLFVNESYEDKSCPENIRKRAFKFNGQYEHDRSEDNYFPYLDSGSYENDKADFVTGLIDEKTDKELRFDSVGDALKYIKENNMNVIDTYEGMIY